MSIPVKSAIDRLRDFAIYDTIVNFGFKATRGLGAAIEGGIRERFGHAAKTTQVEKKARSR